MYIYIYRYIHIYVNSTHARTHLLSYTNTYTEIHKQARAHTHTLILHTQNGLLAMTLQIFNIEIENLKKKKAPMHTHRLRFANHTRNHTQGLRRH